MASAITVTFDDPGERSWFDTFAAQMVRRARDDEARFAASLAADPAGAGRSVAHTWVGTTEAAEAGLAGVDLDVLDGEGLARFAALETTQRAARRHDWELAATPDAVVTLGGHALMDLVVHAAEWVGSELPTVGADPAELAAGARVLARVLTAGAEESVPLFV